MEKRASMKKRKSKTGNADASPVDIKTGPYRNIEEAKKHQVSSFPDIKKVFVKPAE